jgi:beta-N-acetylhexosaminidase
VFRRIIRGELDYRGLVMSDDLSMKALAGTLRQRAEAALGAGCDVALHCNGDLAEMRQVAEAAPAMGGVRRRRAEAALQRIRHMAEPFDPVDARARLDSMLAMAA